MRDVWLQIVLDHGLQSGLTAFLSSRSVDVYVHACMSRRVMHALEPSRFILVPRFISSVLYFIIRGSRELLYFLEIGPLASTNPEGSSTIYNDESGKPFPPSAGMFYLQLLLLP